MTEKELQNKIEEAKKIVCQAGIRLLNEGLVKGTFGNLSVRVSGSLMVITPSGLPYNLLTTNDMVVVNFLTGKFEGERKPSSEKGLHADIYAERPEICAVIHTHQPFASTLAAAQIILPPVVDDMAQIIGENVRVAKYAHSNTAQISINTRKALKNRFAALIANHGAVCVGRNLEEAFIVAQVLEKACKIYIEAAPLGGVKPLSAFNAKKLRKEYLEHYSKNLIS